jgi:hypothetical protein
MKIEFIYKDDSYKAIINELNKSLNLEESGVTYTPIVQVGLNLFSFRKDGDNEATAKKLDEIKSAVCESLEQDNLFIITDDVSSYFCQRLYPIMAHFERGLRKVLYIASIKSKDEKVIALCKEIEQQEFAKIYQMLFSDTAYVTRAKEIVSSKSPALSKHDILKQLSNIEEATVWSKLFNGQYSYIPENFLSIKAGRNKIMHSRNITFEEYSETKNNLEKSNKQLTQIESSFLGKMNYDFDELNDLLSKAIKAIGKAFTTPADTSENPFLATLLKLFSNNSDILNTAEDAPASNLPDDSTTKDKDDNKNDGQTENAQP